MFYNTKLLNKEARLATWEIRSRIALNKLMFKYKYCEEYLDLGNANTRLHYGTVYNLDRPLSKNICEFFISYLVEKFGIICHQK